MFQRKRAAELPVFSKDSTSAVLPCLWFASDFLLGAGMVIIQPETEKIVVIYDTKRNIWFLPKGRKDVGESLEQTALRETYEEVSVCPSYLSPI
jgi:8-oxo-dGTP pyrophosphatase MutT (NUDIX family)